MSGNNCGWHNLEWGDSVEWYASKFSLSIGETFITKKLSVLKVSTTEAEEHQYVPSQQPPPGVQGRPAEDPGVPAYGACTYGLFL